MKPLKKFLSTRLALLFLLIAAGITAYAQQTCTFTPLKVCKENGNGDVTATLSGQKLKISVLPARGGQSALIKFDLTGPNGNVTASAWYKQGISLYDYTYRNTSSGSTRLLILKTSEFSDMISMWIPAKYNDIGSVFFNYPDKNNGDRNKYAYEVMLAPADAKKAFLMAARAVNNLKFRKAFKSTLFIDVDF